jgi:hypothetical protein
MNIAEGTRRMRIAGRCMVLIAFTALTVMWVFAMDTNTPMMGLDGIIFGAFLGALLWMTAWIVEGLANFTR